MIVLADVDIVLRIVVLCVIAGVVVIDVVAVVMVVSIQERQGVVRF